MWHLTSIMMCFLFNFWYGHLSFALFPRSWERDNQTIRELFAIILTTYSNILTYEKNETTNYGKTCLNIDWFFLPILSSIPLQLCTFINTFLQIKSEQGFACKFEMPCNYFNNFMKNNLNWDIQDIQHYE